jgi:predicted metal-dependent hydrolase
MIGFIILICLKIYSESDVFNLKCIISDVDGHRYCVRKREDEKAAANLLAKVTEKCKELVEYLKNKHPNDERVKRLVSGFNPKKISETLPTSELTAYSENKGEKIAFCLNRTKNSTTLIDLNTLTFVSIHELSHIATKSIGHKQEFWQNFKFLLENAKAAGIYDPVDYKKKPQTYCGMTITDNPYYDI